MLDTNLEPSDFRSFCLCPDEFNHSFRDSPENTFSVSHINIRSLNTNIDSFNLFYSDIIKHKFSIIGVSEIWQISGDNLFHLDDYRLEYRVRDTGRGGGVAAYIKPGLRYTVIYKDVSHSESIWLNIQLNSKSAVVGIVYRKPNTNVSEFRDSLIETLHSFKIDKHHCILMGDFNIDLSHAHDLADSEFF